MNKILIIATCTMLTGCTALPDFFKAADDVLTDDCITVKVDRDAFKKDPDVHVTVDVINKEPK